MFALVTRVCLLMIEKGAYFSILSQFMAIFLSLYIIDETYTLLESPFHAELNGLCPNSIYLSNCKLQPNN